MNNNKYNQRNTNNTVFMSCNELSATLDHLQHQRNIDKHNPYPDFNTLSMKISWSNFKNNLQTRYVQNWYDFKNCAQIMEMQSKLPK